MNYYIYQYYLKIIQTNIILMLMKVQFMKYNFKLIKLGSVNLSYKLKYVLLSLLSLFLLMACSIEDDLVQSDTNNQKVTPITELIETENFKSNALEHILEGELNYKGQAVGFHYSQLERDRKSTRLNSSHVAISYAVFCLKK